MRGVIYQRTLARTPGGGSVYGFFLQNTGMTRDADASTSDGIFVFTGRLPALPRDDTPGTYVPAVGDEVVLRGRVAEFNFLTEITSPRLVGVVRREVNLDAEVPAFEAAPPDSLQEADCYWERREGMRAGVPAGSIVTSRRSVFASNLDAEVWVIRGDHPVALRGNPYARRVFRDPHPYDNVTSQLFDDGNGYRILMGSLGIKAAAGANRVLIAPARTFDIVTEVAIGGVHFSFGKYSVQPERQVRLAGGPDPSANGPLRPFDRAFEYSVVTFNVRSLYDFRDDPFDRCDFSGNPGCPGVSPPFDYLPASTTAYQRRLGELASQIVNDLRGPDIIMVQEAEDQDICAVAGGTLSCGTTDNADGKPDVLQELALTIERMGGPRYAAAVDRDGADDRGITSAYLYRTDRVELVPPDPADPVLGVRPRVQYRGAGLAYNAQAQNPKALNAVLPPDVDRSTGVDGRNVYTRAPQVARFRVWRSRIGASAFATVYAVNNHFSSMPAARVGQRREQAAYAAAIIAALRRIGPDVRVIAGGDLNVFPRPDDPFAPGQPLYPSDQLAPLYALGLANLWDRLKETAPLGAYSYIFQGQAQTLDHLFVTPALLADLIDVWASHVNSDWPDAHDADGPRGVADHDPLGARFNALTIGGLMNVLEHLRAAGAIRESRAAAALNGRLIRARAYAAAGLRAAAKGELRAFVSEVQGAAPRLATKAAAEVLRQETMLLLARGFEPPR
ncbi:MAG: hypothetical protein QN120_02980 [Armatimonadota bacterium]|nr:hypothetical protein [Armatimonadota bacterium]